MFLIKHRKHSSSGSLVYADPYDRKYNLIANPGLGLTFYCNTDAANTDSCTTEQGVLGYAPAVGAYAYVTLCDTFFEDIWSSTLCGSPGTTTPPPGTTYIQWRDPSMQAGKWISIAHSFDNAKTEIPRYCFARTIALLSCRAH